MKTTLLLIACFFVFAIQVHGQNQPSITITFDNVSGSEAITMLEEQSQWRIYHDPTWMDSVMISGNYDALPLGAVLADCLEPLGLSTYIEQGAVVLTKGRIIIKQPALAKAYLQKDSAVGFQGSKGLMFSQDYSEETVSANIEDQVKEIGVRSAFVNGGNSTLVGYVKAKETGEGISEALLYLEDFSKSTSTDENGFFSISLPNGRNQLFFQNVGKKTTKRQLLLFSDGQLNVEMEVDVFTLSEVTVSSDRLSNVEDVNMGIQKLNVKETKNVPVVLGERDLMKIATTLAGVQTLGEGAAGYNVRGGKSDQNIILLNNVPIYNANHFLGFFSAFNSDAIKDMEIYKSSIPARLGGRLSAVFDIETLPANKEKFVGVGGVSPITTKLILEIPLANKKAGLMIGGRTSYSNWILERIDNANFRENRVSFSDLMLRYDHQISKKDDLRISAYVSQDKFRLKSDSLFSFSNFNYSNANAAVQWQHQFTEKLRSTFQTYWSTYQYNLENNELAANAFEQDFSIEDMGLTLDVNYFINDDQKIAIGTGSKLYHINPGQKNPLGTESEVIPVQLQEKKGLESFAYVDYELALSPSIRLATGLRYSIFNAIGAFNGFEYAEGLPTNKLTRTAPLSYDGFRQTYHGPEYRLSLRYILNPSSSLKFAINRSRQYLHTLSNSASLSPTDTWTISDQQIRPQISDQLSLGYFKNLKDNTIEVSVEAYYKRLQNLLDFKVGADFILNDQLAEVALQGPGKSYGLELTLRKSGKLNGWINYTFARTFLRLDGDFAEDIINQGEFFPTNYDKPHTVNLVANYKLTKRLSFSYNLNYSTGRPVTYPVGLYEFNGVELVHYSDRNTFRIPDYFRMDIAINLEEGHRLKKLTHSYWSLSIYNLTGRDNPYSVFFDVRDGKVNGYQLIIFGRPIPTLSFNFKF